MTAGALSSGVTVGIFGSSWKIAATAIIHTGLTSVFKGYLNVVVHLRFNFRLMISDGEERPLDVTHQPIFSSHFPDSFLLLVVSKRSSIS